MGPTKKRERTVSKKKREPKAKRTKKVIRSQVESVPILSLSKQCLTTDDRLRMLRTHTLARSCGIQGDFVSTRYLSAQNGIGLHIQPLSGVRQAWERRDGLWRRVDPTPTGSASLTPREVLFGSTDTTDRKLLSSTSSTDGLRETCCSACATDTPCCCSVREGVSHSLRRGSSLLRIAHPLAGGRLDWERWSDDSVRLTAESLRWMEEGLPDNQQGLPGYGLDPSPSPDPSLVQQLRDAAVARR